MAYPLLILPSRDLFELHPLLHFFPLSFVWLEAKMWGDQGFPEFERRLDPASMGQVPASSQPDSAASERNSGSFPSESPSSLAVLALEGGQGKGLECRRAIFMLLQGGR